MARTCASCGKQFTSNVSLDRHGPRCPQRRQRRPPVAGTLTPNSRKRARLELPEVGDDGPSHSDLPEDPPFVRSVRSGRIPRYLEDYVPHGDMSLAHVPPRAPTPIEHDNRYASPTIETPVADPQPHPLQTAVNKLGVFRRYTHPPSWHPKNDERLDLVYDSPSIDTPPPVNREAIHEISHSMSETFAPFTNFSTALFMATYFTGSDTKSETHATSLAKMTQHPKFQRDELRNFNAHVENVRLDNYLKHGTEPFQIENGWREGIVYIRLPVEGKSFKSEDAAPLLPIYGLKHRRIVDIVRSVCASTATASFHFTPFTMHWCPDPDKPHEHERVYADAYMSDSMIQAQSEVDAIPRAEGDTKERVVLGLMFASDSAQLTSFGSASVWPIYLMFANQPKQERVRPSCHAVHHLAYVPSLGADFASRYQRATETDKVPSPDLQAHCKRELMQAVWSHLMDADFVKGCTDGMTIMCSDGKERVFFLRIMTYSADYPEKAHLATIKNLGRNPCPRCLILKKNIHNVGTPTDAVQRKRIRVDNASRRQDVERARKALYQNGCKITDTQVQSSLTARSMVPTRNAFSEKLAEVGQDFHDFFVVDLLHEFELGIWKSVLTHLIRMLHATPAGQDRIALLNERFDSVPTFGCDTIRKLPDNVSELSKLAARDYEDILQCSIPVFDGLFLEEDNRSISELLFLLATWHAYAKLRLHTDTTLAMLELVSKALCQALRHFATVTCPRYTTKELPREVRQRIARQQTQATRGHARAGNTTSSFGTGKVKRFNMSTYKMHCIPDYPDAIRKHGTTDSYNTQTSELAHRLSKLRYKLSNRNRSFVKQTSDKESRTRFYVAMLKDLTEAQVPSSSEATHPEPDPKDGENGQDKPGDQYWMSKKHAETRDLTEWLIENKADRALNHFQPRLLDHLLARVKGTPYDGDEHRFTDQDRDNIIIDHNRIYEHKTIRFRSTTYDARRIEESAEPHKADVLVLSHEDGADDRLAFPYWHARIIGIYHFMVRERTNGGLSPPSRMDVLFVRWFGFKFDSPDGKSGWRARQMHKVGFLPDTDAHGPAFGFLDPKEVIRMVHLIPDFSSIRTKELLTGKSMAIPEPDTDGEYPTHYVAMFSDRDLFMRYRGGGVGHTATRQCSKILLADEHTLLPDEYVFPEEDEHIGNEGNDSESDKDSDLDGDEADHNPDIADLQLLDDTAILDAAGLASL